MKETLKERTTTDMTLQFPLQKNQKRLVQDIYLCLECCFVTSMVNEKGNGKANYWHLRYCSVDSYLAASMGL